MRALVLHRGEASRANVRPPVVGSGELAALIAPLVVAVYPLVPIIRLRPSVETVAIEFSAQVEEARQLESLARAEALRGQHIWRDEVIAHRFDWGKDKMIHALAVRVFRLARAVEVPMAPLYGGCKSWIELECDIATDGAVPVLSDAAFERKLDQFRAALALSATSLKAGS